MDLQLGKKRLCSLCSTTFFDMNSIRPKCPKCGESFIFARGAVKPGRPKTPTTKTKNTKKDINTDVPITQSDLVLPEEIEFDDPSDFGIIDSI